MANESVFLGGTSVSTSAAGALGGDGSIGDPLQVNVDGTTIEVNGSNELTVIEAGLNSLIPSATTSTVSVAAASGTTQTVTVQLKNAAGTNLSAVYVFDLYMVTASTGLGAGVALPDTAGTVSATGNVTSSANGATMRNTALFQVAASAAGVFAFVVDNVGGAGAYQQRAAIVLPDGIVVSAALNVPNA